MIKTAVLNRKCKKLSKLQKSENLSYGGANSIGILYNALEFDKSLIEELSDSFNGDGKETASMAYTTKETDDRFSFCKKDVSISGEFKKEPIEFFTNRAFDFLISLDTSGDINFKYVLALSKATCKVGISSGPLEDLLVLSFRKSEDKSQNVKDIIKYLKMI